MIGETPSPQGEGVGATRNVWLAFAVGVVAVHGFFLVWPEVLLFVGLHDYGVRFLDSFAILASNDALARGMNVFASNPLDYFQRPHVYSSWWLVLGDLGLTRAHNTWVGGAWVAAFLVAALAALRPRSAGEAMWYLVVLVAPPVLMAVNRANNDLVIFVLLACVVPCLTSRHRALRFLAIGPIALAAGLKFYPAAATALVMVGRDGREVRERAWTMAAVLVLVGIAVASDVAMFARIGPQPDGLLTFGAAHILGTLGLQGATAAVVAASLVLASFLLGWRWAKESVAVVLERIPRSVWLQGALGALLLVGCFVAGRNYSYRWVFAVWLAPFLWQLMHLGAGSNPLRRSAIASAVFLLLLLWLDPALSLTMGLMADPASAARAMRWVERIIVAEQLVAWVFFLGLGALLGAMAGKVSSDLRAKVP